MNFSMKNFFSKCDKSPVSCGFGRIYWRNPNGKMHVLCHSEDILCNDSKVTRRPLTWPLRWPLTWPQRMFGIVTLISLLRYLDLMKKLYILKKSRTRGIHNIFCGDAQRHAQRRNSRWVDTFCWFPQGTKYDMDF